ncbi:TPA: hypothetical protein HA317_01440 [Candidatus Woesearchaeota archaeon]|nr:hypothetical protein [Candidatus Woesearchaeota archaeon]
MDGNGTVEDVIKAWIDEYGKPDGDGNLCVRDVILGEKPFFTTKNGETTSEEGYDSGGDKNDRS